MLATTIAATTTTRLNKNIIGSNSTNKKLNVNYFGNIFLRWGMLTKN